MFSSRIASLYHKSQQQASLPKALLQKTQWCLSIQQAQRSFTKKATAATTTKASAAKKKTHGVYLWSKLPRLGAKSGSVSTNLSMPKGMPQRISEFDELNV